MGCRAIPGAAGRRRRGRAAGAGPGERCPAAAPSAPSPRLPGRPSAPPSAGSAGRGDGGRRLGPRPGPAPAPSWAAAPGTCGGRRSSASGGPGGREGERPGSVRARGRWGAGWEVGPCLPVRRRTAPPSPPSALSPSASRPPPRAQRPRGRLPPPISPLVAYPVPSSRSPLPVLPVFDSAQDPGPSASTPASVASSPPIPPSLPTPPPSCPPSQPLGPTALSSFSHCLRAGKVCSIVLGIVGSVRPRLGGAGRGQCMVWCVSLWPLSQRRPVRGMQSAAVQLLFPAGSNSKWACVCASGVSMGGVGAGEHAGRDTPVTGLFLVWGGWAWRLTFSIQMPSGKWPVPLRGGRSGAGGTLGLSLVSRAGSFGSLPHITPELFPGTACDLGILLSPLHLLCDGPLLPPANTVSQ